MTDMVAEAMGELLGCLRTAAAELEDPPGRVCLRHGDVVALLISTTEDECCEGLGWVRLVNTYPSTDFPNQDVEAPRCPPAVWAVVLEVGIARCVPVGDAENIPTCEELEASALELLADRVAMIRAVCCFQDLDGDRMVLRGLYTPAPSEGGCGGGTVQVTVAVPACECEQETP